MSALSFPSQEFESRLQNIRRQMSSKGLNALVLSRPQNIYYASGYRGAIIASWTSQIHVLVIPDSGEPRIMTRALEGETVKTQWTKNPVLYLDHEDPFKVVHDILAESGNTSGKIGIEEGFLSLRQVKGIQKVIPNAKFVDATGLVEGVRATPSKAESECIRHAAKLATLGFEKAIENSRAGAYPYEVLAEIHHAMYKAGQTDFDVAMVALWSGPRGGRMHDTATTERIAKGDLVTIEIHGVHKLYKAGAQGSIYVGENPPGNIVDAYKMVSNMYERARDAVKPGCKAEEVYYAANTVYRPARGADYFRRVGGSIGLSLFDIDLVKDKRDELKPGVSLLVQPLVNDPALITCCGTVMVTENGREELTKPLPQLVKV